MGTCELILKWDSWLFHFSNLNQLYPIRTGTEDEIKNMFKSMFNKLPVCTQLWLSGIFPSSFFQYLPFAVFSWMPIGSAVMEIYHNNKFITLKSWRYLFSSQDQCYSVCEIDSAHTVTNQICLETITASCTNVYNEYMRVYWCYLAIHFHKFV